MVGVNERNVQKNKASNRVPWFDFLRGVAILMVVAIHTFPTALPPQGMAGDGLIVLRQLLNCAVPLFLAISGYFLIQKSRQRSYAQFWRRQIPKVYVPALLWSLPFLALYLFWKGGDWWKGLLLFFVCGFSIYYFIALIIQYYLLLPVLSKVKRGGVIVSFFITVLATGVVSYLNLVKGCGLSFIASVGPFPVWLVFFTVGVYLGKMRERTYALWPWFVLLAVGLALSVLETKWVYPFHHTGYGIKPSTQLYSLAAIVLLFSQRVQAMFTSGGRVFRAFVALGRISFGVYLVHCYFLVALPHLGSGLVGWAVRTLAGLLLSVGLIVCVRRFLPSVARRVGF